MGKVYLSSLRKKSNRMLRRFLASGIRRKLVCLVLILSLLILPVQSSTFQQVSVFASATVKSVTTSVNYVPTLFNWMFGAKPPQRRARKETLAERASAVSRLQISPIKFG